MGEKSLLTPANILGVFQLSEGCCWQLGVQLQALTLATASGSAAILLSKQKERKEKTEREKGETKEEKTDGSEK